MGSILSGCSALSPGITGSLIKRAATLKSALPPLWIATAALGAPATLRAWRDNNTFVATGRDLPRQGATDNDTDFSLSLEEVAERYARAGHPRTLRSLQRYCVSGHLEARKIATAIGDKYLVTPQSVARHIAQIVELSQLDAVATGRDMSRPVATAIPSRESTTTTAPENGSYNAPDIARQAATEAAAGTPLYPQEPRQEAAPSHDTMRQAATETIPQVTETPIPLQEPRHEPTTPHHLSRPVATEQAATGAHGSRRCARAWRHPLCCRPPGGNT